MDKYCTSIRAVDPKTGELATYCGPEVPGISFKDAEDYCQRNGLGYCKVDGRLISEIPTKADGFTPDWDKKIDYENPRLN